MLAFMLTFFYHITVTRTGHINRYNTHVFTFLHAEYVQNYLFRLFVSNNVKYI